MGCTAANRRRFGGRIMASRAQPSLWRESVKAGAARSGALFAAIGIALVTLAIALALATYNAGDAALKTAAGGPTRNFLGVPGAWVSDLLLTIAGRSAEHPSELQSLIRNLYA